MNQREWVLKRNCSLSPRQSLAALGGLCLAILVFAMPFVLFYGAWLVLVFACIETLALATAFLHYARHARDHEHIVLANGSLLVECIEALLGHAGRRTAGEIMGVVDGIKLLSCLTLFEAAGGGPIFGQAIEAFYGGERDRRTLAIIEK